jgi:hypothetical protein
MSRVNGATSALSIGPSARYTLFLVFVYILLLFTAYVSSDTHMHIHAVTYITLIFWIKLKLKISIFPTVKDREYSFRDVARDSYLELDVVGGQVRYKINAG